MRHASYTRKTWTPRVQWPMAYEYGAPEGSTPLEHYAALRCLWHGVGVVERASFLPGLPFRPRNPIPPTHTREAFFKARRVWGREVTHRTPGAPLL
eukprot:6746946-Prymnesium_polylepis.1